MIAKLMKVLKNLFGNNSKIYADNIVVGTKNNHTTLSKKLKAEELWIGNEGNKGAVLNLSQPLTDFEKMVVWFSADGQEFRDWYFRLTDYIDLKANNLDNAGESTYHRHYELRLTKVSDTRLEITHNVMLTYSGGSFTMTPNGDARVYGILGYR